MNPHFLSEEYPFQQESYSIIGIAMEVHRILGKGFSEIVYKDALEYELKQRNIPWEREKKFTVCYKNVTLPHHFFADFIIDQKIILEIKCRSKIIEDHYAQVLNYLAISKIKLGLILNFAEKSLEYKRVVNSR